jgi:hypothetical protein
MSSDCEYEQEDFCIFEDVEGFDAKCPFKDKDNHCTAKPEDIEPCCEMCGSSECYNEECLEKSEVQDCESEKHE